MQMRDEFLLRFNGKEKHDFLMICFPFSEYSLILYVLRKCKLNSDVAYDLLVNRKIGEFRDLFYKNVDEEVVDTIYCKLDKYYLDYLWRYKTFNEIKEEYRKERIKVIENRKGGVYEEEY